MDAKISTLINPELHRKLSNWSIIICLSYLTLLITIMWLLDFPYMHNNIPGSIASCALTIVHLGIYSKGCYRLIWKGKDISRVNLALCLLLPLSLIIYFVWQEYISPSFEGPLNWACREMGHDWFGCWRFYWISIILRDALKVSIIGIYAIIGIRWLLNICKKK